MKFRAILVPYLLFTLSLVAQEKTEEVKNHDKYIESDVIPLAGKKGFSFESKAGDFVFKPFALEQASAKMNYYDDEQIGADDQDNVANSGFEVGNALIGFAGKAFDKVTFNMTLNAAQSGDALLQQAWVDLNLKDELRFRVISHPTPLFNHACKHPLFYQFCKPKHSNRIRPRSTSARAIEKQMGIQSRHIQWNRHKRKRSKENNE